MVVERELFRQRRTERDRSRAEALKNGAKIGKLGTIIMPTQNQNIDLEKVWFDKRDVAKAIALVQLQRRRIHFVRDFGTYVVFMVLLLVIMFVGWDIETKYNYGAGMKDLLVRKVYRNPALPEAQMTFGQISRANEFWAWTQSALTDGLFPRVGFDEEEPEFQNYPVPFSKVIGTMRFRQLRSKPRDCLAFKRIKKVPPGFNPVCYSNYDPDHEDTEPFGKDGRFTYSSRKDTDTFQWRSVSELILYGAGGYVVDFPITDRASFNATLSEIREARYIDMGTRAVFININLANFAIRRYHSIQLLVEFLNTGNVVVLDQKFRTFRVDQYESSQDFFKMFLEIVFCLFVIIYIYTLIRELFYIYKRQQVFEYGSRITFWHFVDIVSMMLFVSGIILRFYILANPLRRRLTDAKELFSNINTEYIPLEELASLDYTFDSIMAASVAVSFFKAFKFLQVNAKLSLIWHVLVKALPNMFSFLIFFVIVFLAFVVLGYIVFGPEMREFRAFGVSFSTLGRMVFGSFNYEPMSFTQPYIAPIYFYLFMILVYFILLNMFLAILNDTYQFLIDEYEKKIARQKEIEEQREHEEMYAYEQEEEEAVGVDGKMAKRTVMRRRRLTTVTKPSVWSRFTSWLKRSFNKLRGKKQTRSLNNLDNILKDTKFTEEEIVTRFRKSSALKNKEFVQVRDLQAALGSDAPPNLAYIIMENLVASGETTDNFKKEEEMNELLGFSSKTNEGTRSEKDILGNIQDLFAQLKKQRTSRSRRFREFGETEDGSDDSFNERKGGVRRRKHRSRLHGSRESLLAGSTSYDDGEGGGGSRGRGGAGGRAKTRHGGGDSEDSDDRGSHRHNAKAAVRGGGGSSGGGGHGARSLPSLRARGGNAKHHDGYDDEQDDSPASSSLGKSGSQKGKSKMSHGGGGGSGGWTKKYSSNEESSPSSSPVNHATDDEDNDQDESALTTSELDGGARESYDDDAYTNV